jgi:hypothetical protein
MSTIGPRSSAFNRCKGAKSPGMLCNGLTGYHIWQPIANGTSGGEVQYKRQVDEVTRSPRIRWRRICEMYTGIKSGPGDHPSAFLGS